MKKIKIPLIITERLILRAFHSGDLENVYKGLSHPQVIKYYGVSFDSQESAKEQMNWFRDHQEHGTGVWWAICIKDTGKFIGACGLNDIEEQHQKAEIGCWLLPEYWGNGFMGEVLPEIMKHGFDELKLHRVEAFVESENVNSKRALQKLNFSREGILRHAEKKNGKFIDIEIFAKLSTD